MARTTKVVALGAYQFEITTLGAVRARGVWLQVMKAVGPALEKIDQARAQGKDGEAVLAAMVTSVFEHVSKEMLDDLCSTFSEATRVKQGPVWVPMSDNVFDEVFAANYSTLQLWLTQHVVLNEFIPFLAVSRPTSPAVDDGQPTP